MKEMYSGENHKKIIKNVEVCKALYLTKDGKVYSCEAEEFIENMKEFNIYLKPDKIDLWNNEIRRIIYDTFAYISTANDEPGVKRTVEARRARIIGDLFAYINAGEIMRVYKQTNSWDEVYKTLQEQSHSGNTFSEVALVIKEFSVFGLEFIQKYAPHMIKENKKEVEDYEKELRETLRIYSERYEKELKDSGEEQSVIKSKVSKWLEDTVSFYLNGDFDIPSIIKTFDFFNEHKIEIQTENIPINDEEDVLDKKFEDSEIQKGIQIKKDKK